MRHPVSSVKILTGLVLIEVDQLSSGYHAWQADLIRSVFGNFMGSALTLGGLSELLLLSFLMSFTFINTCLIDIHSLEET